LKVGKEVIEYADEGLARRPNPELQGKNLNVLQTTKRR
jgi:hypothetical protein